MEKTNIKEEFTVEALPKATFAIPSNISPLDILALSTQVDLDDVNKTRELFKFALEHTLVKTGEIYQPVKAKDREVYLPTGIENNIIALSQVANYFLENVITKAFTKSSESE